jgi:hypothetical protein
MNRDANRATLTTSRTTFPALTAFLAEVRTTAARHVYFGLWSGGIMGSVVGVALGLLGARVRGDYPNAFTLALFGGIVLALGGALYGALAGGLVGCLTATLLSVGTFFQAGSAPDKRDRSREANPAFSEEIGQL